MENVVKRGTLQTQVRGILQSKQWQSRYYVLYGATTTNQARLDFFESEAAYQKDPSKRKTFYLEEIQEVVVSPDSVKGRDFVFDLVLDRGRKKLIAAESRDELQDWVTAIREVRGGLHRVSIKGSRSSNISATSNEAEDIVFDENTIYEAAGSDIYEVDVAATEAAKRCGLPASCLLSIGSKTIEVLSTPERKTLFVWQFKSIRRYGRNKNSFSFEAGRKCATGEGLFSFQTEIGEMIFESVQRRTRTLREKCNSATGGAGPEENAPDLPDRNYNKENYVELAVLSQMRHSQESLNGSQNSLSSEGQPANKRLTPPPLPLPPPEENIYCEANEVKIKPGPVMPTHHLYSEPLDIDTEVDLDTVDGMDPKPPRTDAEGYEMAQVYAEPSKVKVGPRPQPPPKKVSESGEPEYAVYDVAQSTRFVRMDGQPDTEDDKPQVGKITTILEQLRMNKLTDGAPDGIYDAVQHGGYNPATVKLPENVYRNVDGRGPRPPVKEVVPENLYDDIANLK